MKLRQVGVVAVAVLALGACKKKAPEVAPTPSENMEDARARARADSIAAAEAAARRAREEAERAQAQAVARTRELLTQMIFFAYDSEALTPEAEALLRTKAEILRANPSLEIRVEGNADERGSTEYNLALGQRRAESVKSFMAGYGISGNRISTISYGKERPLVEGNTEEAFAQNRRAEFVVTGGDVTAVPAGVE
jgi:peptidoglycan-associated lipoprotein